MSKLQHFKRLRISLLLLLTISVFYRADVHAQKSRLRDFGVKIGVVSTGEKNSITDVSGVKVGHVTIHQGDSINTGVTAIIPHDGNVFQSKVPAAIELGNGFGKLAGYSQVKELGFLETPIILTNTLSVPIASNALVTYTLQNPENDNVRSVNPIVGETNDGYLNDIRGRHVEEVHVLQAINNANDQVAEGNIGAGTGTVCFGFKGGIGTSSRLLPENLGGYTIGVLVQSNFGGVLTIDGVEIGEKLGKFSFRNQLGSTDGSCMIVVATDAPITARNLERLAKRSLLGLGRTGGIASNGSGDYVIAFSTAEELREPYQSEEPTQVNMELRNDRMSPLFLAVIEATEEAIINSLFAAESMNGHRGSIDQLPVDKVIQLLQQAGKTNN